MIATGGSCISGGITGLAAAATAMLLSGRIDPVAVKKLIDSGGLVPEYFPMMILFFAAMAFGVLLRVKGLSKLKKLAETPKLKSKNG